MRRSSAPFEGLVRGRRAGEGAFTFDLTGEVKKVY